MRKREGFGFGETQIRCFGGLGAMEGLILTSEKHVSVGYVCKTETPLGFAARRRGISNGCASADS